MLYKKNFLYFKKPYYSPNVESFIFRFYGRILKFDFNITGKNKEKILDFGCGGGGNLKYFSKLGFKTYGVDITTANLKLSKKINKSLITKLVSPKPKNQLYFPNIAFDVVISIQTLDFLNNKDMKIAINNLYNNMKKGGIIYCSLNAYSNYYRKHGKYLGDGLWNIKLKTDRINYNLNLNFVKKKEMKKIFYQFKPIYIDYYDSSFRNEGSEKRFTFLGIKE